MYVATFDIEFPDIAELSKFVTSRHDLVHRNGKTKEGNEVIVTPEMITELISYVIAFVEEISEKLQLRN